MLGECTRKRIVEKHCMKVVEPNFYQNRSNSKMVLQKTNIVSRNPGIKTLTRGGECHDLTIWSKKSPDPKITGTAIYFLFLNIFHKYFSAIRARSDTHESGVFCTQAGVQGGTPSAAK